MPDSNDVAAQVVPLTQRVDELLREVQDQRGQLKRLTLAHAIDARQIDRLRTVADVWDARAIEAHVREAVAAAAVITDPFPHLVIEPLLPLDVFRVLLDAVPPDDFFEGENNLDLKGIGLDKSIVPQFSQVIWSSVRFDIIGRALGPALAARFRPFAREFLRISLGEEFVEEALSLPLYPHGLRLMLRRPGWGLPPHLDPKDQFINTLLYLAQPGEPESYGTQLFRVHQENFVSGWANTYYPEEDGLRCELAKTLPYRGNVCLAFLNLGGGAHGAALPNDAPPDMRRMVCQFYIGPDREELGALVDRLPADRQVAWKKRVEPKERRTMRREAEAAAYRLARAQDRAK